MELSHTIREPRLDQRSVARSPYVIEIARFERSGESKVKTLDAIVDVRARSIQFRAQAWDGTTHVLCLKTATLTKAIHAYNEA